MMQTAAALRHAQRILVITGAGLSADSGLPTYRGVGGLYNGKTDDGLPIEMALSGPMLRRDPELCWKYIAELGKACLGGEPNVAHYAIAQLAAHQTRVLGADPERRRLSPRRWQPAGTPDRNSRAALATVLPILWR
ncbi:putative protein-dependent deacetylase [Pseudomonas amygdali pv. mori]|uniref:protein acetyllysine N-acetyltransferase n=1 Tax=Pseudomonas amygdali pv. mori TaxID=34065 RepID=A0A3M4KW05_PSEA0|nr:putative protein-dependent deacetylase [Pseudomonas amygdali pv. mori]RMR46189.1 putative protein-dependent deacetylase [Pseudomonas amygdali pv. mori]